MPRAISSELLAELNLTYTRPGYLVKIDFSTPLYLSTIGDVEWDGNTWAAADIVVSNLKRDEKGNQSGQLSLGNVQFDYGILVLNEGVSDRGVTIYSVWAGCIEPIIEFVGVGDAADIGERVGISLTTERSTTALSPRRFINSSAGFNTILPAGTPLNIGQTTFILTRD